jgi:hypothetical protein
MSGILAFFTEFAKIKLMKKLLFLLILCFALPTFASGTLEVSVSSHRGVVPKNGIRIPFLTIQARAKDEAVKISEIRVTRNGLSEDNDIQRIIAITDNYRRSMRAGINEGIATLRFRNPLIIKSGETETITVYGNLNMTTASGRTIGLSLEGIESDAQVKPIAKRALRVTHHKRAYKIVCRNRKCVRVKR